MAEATVQQPRTTHHHSAATRLGIENQKLAMWLYLASEVVIFSILIAGYVIFRIRNADSVLLLQDTLGVALVSVNTFVLLASSFAMVMGLRAIEMGNRQGFYRWIGLTALMGVIFLGGQFIEYSELRHLGITLERETFSVETNLFEKNIEVTMLVETDDGEVAVNPREAVLFGRNDTLPTDLSELGGEPVLAPDFELTEALRTQFEDAGIHFVQGEITTYTLDFDDEAQVFAGLNFDNTRTRLEYNNDMLLLDEAGALISDETAISEELIALNNGQRTSLKVPLSRLGIETVDGSIVPFTSIIAGEEVTLNPEQYRVFNDYFRTLLAESTAGFGMRFYTPTAFHGLHVFIGVLWALLVLWRGSRGRYEQNAVGVEIFGLYWHFVDVVWILLFTLIYLI